VDSLLATETFAYVRLDRILKAVRKLPSDYDIKNNIIHKYTFFNDTNENKEYDESNFIQLAVQTAQQLEMDETSWRDWPFIKEPADGGFYDYRKPAAATLTTREERKKRNREVAESLIEDRKLKK
jgi:hypothetical protein